jgi:chaperonin GroEL
MLTTEVLVAEKPKKKDESAHGGGGGGMGGMGGMGGDDY